MVQSMTPEEWLEEHQIDLVKDCPLNGKPHWKTCIARQKAQRKYSEGGSSAKYEDCAKCEVGKRVREEREGKKACIGKRQKIRKEERELKVVGNKQGAAKCRECGEEPVFALGFGKKCYGKKYRKEHPVDRAVIESDEAVITVMQKRLAWHQSQIEKIQKAIEVLQ